MPDEVEIYVREVI